MSAAFLLASALLFGGAELHEHQRGLIKLDTDLDTDSREDVFALATESVRKAGEMLTALGMTKKSDQDLRLRVYSHEADFEEWQRRVQNWKTATEPLAFYQEDDRIVVSAWKNGAADARAELRGECARVTLLNWAKNPPNWFEEGFVAYFEGFVADELGDVIDTVHAQHLDAMRRAFQTEHYCPLFELMDLQDVDYFGYAGAKKLPWSRGTLTAESWSLVFFLLQTHDPEMTRFRKMVVEWLETGRWSQAAFRTALVPVEKKWRESIASDDQLLFGRTVKSGWEALKAGQFANARAKASSALAIDDRCRSARRVLARAAFGEGDFDTAASAYGHLIDDVATDQDALLGAADSLLASARKTQDAKTAEKALAAGRRAANALPEQLRYLGLLRAIDAAELTNDTKLALDLVRECQRSKGVPRETQNFLLEKETTLVKRSIGREKKSAGG